MFRSTIRRLMVATVSAAFALTLSLGSAGSVSAAGSANAAGPAVSSPAAASGATYNGGALQVNGKCLDVTGAGTANGTLVELWDCNGGGNQQWQQNGDTLVNPASGRCLDDPGFSSTNGTQVEIWDCNGGVNQNWTMS
ncbi:hypothetical protein ABH926_006069 [Catenulispora sp. GP43]|uniref:ricin-type beta-trefoil lectin domain protein n=1 Tax=Catenulispora sp. GP43 TaxID=3156263 RepID=UPI003511FBFF